MDPKYFRPLTLPEQEELEFELQRHRAHQLKAQFKAAMGKIDNAWRMPIVAAAPPAGTSIIGPVIKEDGTIVFTVKLDKPIEFVPMKFISVGSCKCDIKDLMSRGHDSHCPEKK